MLQNPSTSQRILAPVSFRLPPIHETGPGTPRIGPTMVTRSNAQQMIYRSIPPRPLNSYTFTDMLATGVAPRTQTAPVSTNTPSDYAKRFKSRATTKPKVVQFDAGRVPTESHKRRMHGFFPPVKLRGSTKMRLSDGSEIESQPNSSRMNLVPTTYSEMRSKSSRSMSRKSNRSSRKSPDSVQTAPEQAIVYPSLLSENIDCDDLSYLPPPKRIMPRRELPWVFRYKVKRSMNDLAKIMASKAIPTVDQST